MSLKSADLNRTSTTNDRAIACSICFADPAKPAVDPCRLQIYILKKQNELTTRASIKPYSYCWITMKRLDVDFYKSSKNSCFQDVSCRCLFICISLKNLKINEIIVHKLIDGSLRIIQEVAVDLSGTHV